MHHGECTIVVSAHCTVHGRPERCWSNEPAVIFVVVPGARRPRRGSRRGRPRPSTSSPCRCPAWTVRTLLPPRQLTCFLQQPLRLPHHHRHHPHHPPPQGWSHPEVSTLRASALSRVWSPGQNLKLNDPEGEWPPSVSHPPVRIKSHRPLSLVSRHPHSVTPSLVRKATVTAVESGQSVYFYL